MPNCEPEAVAAGSSGLLSRNLLGTSNRAPQDLLWEKLLFLDRLRDLYQKVRKPECGPILENLLTELQILYEVNPEELARIPKSGPLLSWPTTHSACWKAPYSACSCRACART
jgi:hypothetical protein